MTENKVKPRLEQTNAQVHYFIHIYVSTHLNESSR